RRSRPCGTSPTVPSRGPRCWSSELLCVNSSDNRRYSHKEASQPSLRRQETFDSGWTRIWACSRLGGGSPGVRISARPRTTTPHLGDPKTVIATRGLLDRFLNLRES